MKLKEFFKNVLSYAAGMENWVDHHYEMTGYKRKYTFVSDFAIADWYGRDTVMETYKRVKKDWIKDYKAFTEVVMALNLLSWAHDALKRQGIEGRDEWVKLYSDLYCKAEDDFYKKWEGNEEATSYFFHTTD